VLVCKQHYTVVINLDKHLLEHYATQAIVRKEIVAYFEYYARANLKAIQLLEPLVPAVKELGSLLNGL
jgi:hypothetical protein